MALPPSDTFKYFAIIPADMEEPWVRWPLQLGETIKRSGDALFDFRLVGYSPLLRIADGGTIPDPTGLRTTMTRSRLTLSASSRENATHSDVSFYVDRELTLLFKPGDVLHLSHSSGWGTGLSLLRNNQLVFAVGAILSVPLGNNVQAKLPGDVMDQIKRYSNNRHPDTKHLYIPLEIHVGDQMRSLFRGTVELGDHQIWVERGNDFSHPMFEECAAISVKGACESMPAVASAKLLGGPNMEFNEWPK